jgi:hypothetical protein
VAFLVAIAPPLPESRRTDMTTAAAAADGGRGFRYQPDEQAYALEFRSARRCGCICSEVLGPASG